MAICYQKMIFYVQIGDLLLRDFLCTDILKKKTKNKHLFETNSSLRLESKIINN